MFESYRQLFTRHLQAEWSRINAESLGGRLKRPVFSILEGDTRLGTWNADSRTLSISAELLLKGSEHEIEETLKHEIAHQFADEVLEANRHPGELPHGSGFRYACDLLGISHSARLVTKEQASPILSKIRKLLALAESPNVHEAEAAMARARTLMDRYELDLGLRDHDFCYNWIGEPIGQRSAIRRSVASLLVTFFGVELVWIPSQLIHSDKKVWIMEICGTRTNLEIAGYVFDYMMNELQFLWLSHQRRHPLLKGKSPKRDFQLGVMRGLREKLSKEEGEPQSSGTRELVLIKQEKLKEFYHDRHPNLSRGRAFTVRHSASFMAGLAEGRNLDIHRGIKAGEKATRGPTRRLGSGS